jgi:hypothetical protein
MIFHPERTTYIQPLITLSQGSQEQIMFLMKDIQNQRFINADRSKIQLEPIAKDSPIKI